MEDVQPNFCSSKQMQENVAFNQAQVSLNRRASVNAARLRRPQRVNWRISNEKETYNTVVVNYHFDKRNAKNKHMSRSTELGSDRMKSKIPEAVSSYKLEENDDYDDVLDLRDLYEGELAEENADERHETMPNERFMGDVGGADHQQEQQTEESEPEYSMESETEYNAKNTKGIANKNPKKSVKYTDILQKGLSCDFCPHVIVLDHDENSETDTDPKPVEAPTSSGPLSCGISNSQMSSKNTGPPPASPQSQHGGNRTTGSGQSKEKSDVGGTPKERPLKVKTQTSTLKIRQLELHRHRIMVEEKRLELLSLKLARERDEMLREQILFEKELEIKESHLKRLQETAEMVGLQ